MAEEWRGTVAKNAPYESGEATTGESRDVDNEYMPHFMLFLPFEIVIAILILWSIAPKGLGYYTNVAILMIGFVATVLSFFGYKIGKWLNGQIPKAAHRTQKRNSSMQSKR